MRAALPMDVCPSQSRVACESVAVRTPLGKNARTMEKSCHTGYVSNSPLSRRVRSPIVADCRRFVALVG